MTRALPAMRTIERAGLPPIVKKLKRIPKRRHEDAEDPARRLARQHEPGDRDLRRADESGRCSPSRRGSPRRAAPRRSTRASRARRSPTARAGRRRSRARSRRACCDRPSPHRGSADRPPWSAGTPWKHRGRVGTRRTFAPPLARYRATYATVTSGARGCDNRAVSTYGLSEAEAGSPARRARADRAARDQPLARRASSARTSSRSSTRSSPSFGALTLGSATGATRSSSGSWSRTRRSGSARSCGPSARSTGCRPRSRRTRRSCATASRARSASRRSCVGDLVRGSSRATASSRTERSSRSAGLEVDESILTGESRPVARAVGEEVRSGSFAVEGAGRVRRQRGRARTATRSGSRARRASSAIRARRSSAR